MAAGASFFFFNSFKIFFAKPHHKTMSFNELSTLLISFIIILTPLISISIYGISIGKILAIYTILFACTNLSPQNCTVIGSMVSFTILLNSSEQNPYILFSFIIGAFLASCAKKYNAFGICFVFIIINSLAYFSVALITDENIINNLIELFIASFGFILSFNHIKKILPPNKNNSNMVIYENTKNLMLLKLYCASNSLHDIANSTQKLSDTLSQNFKPDINEVFQKSTSSICKECDLKMFCWNTSYNEVMNNFNDLISTLKQKGNISLSDVPHFLSQKCKNIDSLITNLNDNYRNFITKKSFDRKFSDYRNVISDQFDAISIMLRDLANEFYTITNFDKQTAIKAKKVLCNMGLNVSSISSFTDIYGRLTIEATTNIIKNSDQIGKSISLELSDICNRNFSLPSFIKVNQNTRLTIIEKATFDIDFGATQLSSNNLKNCGDSYNFFINSKGKAFMILSDGMGTGNQAAIDGTMTTSLLSKLINAGFDFEAASKIVNSTLLVKPGEESLSTIDVSCINLYTGKTDMFKVGAAPTFTRKSNKIMQINCSTLPAGILRTLTFDKKTISLKNNDIIIMVSDGVTNNDYDWLLDEIKSFKYNLSAKELSRKIALESKLRNKLHHEDDITVMVGIISKGI